MTETETIEYTVVDFHDTRLLVAGPDHWLILDLVPDEPIRMRRYESEAEARGAFLAS